MADTEITMTTSQETNLQKPPIQKRATKRTEIKTDGTGPKLYYLDPVCPHCRAKKIACHHRAVYDEFGNLVKPADEPPKLVGPKSTSGQTKKAVEKAAVNIITKSIEIAENESVKPTETALASQRPRRANAGKRKLDDTSNETATANDSKCQKTERKKPGRKPRQKTPIPIVIVEDTEEEPPAVSSPTTEPSNTPAVIQQRNGGNVNPSIDMAWHRGMTTLYEKHINDTKQKWETLRNIIEEAEKQWEDVQNSMQATKNFMTEWTSRWTMSDAFTL